MLKKILIILGCVIGAIVIAGVGYAYYVYQSVEDTAGKIYHPVDQADNTENTNKKLPKDESGGPEPISILLMGIDQRPGTVGRSDTLIVTTLNPDTQTMQMVSIPRDSRVKLIGKGKNADDPKAGTIDKINHAYAFGGVKMSIDTVEHFLHINIDHYIRIDMQGLIDLVNALGGVKVYNDDSWHDPGYYKKGHFYHQGWLTFETGAEALGYVRMRYIPGGDFTRNEHQRELIMAIIDKAASFQSVTKFQDILDAIEENVMTDFTFDQMIYVARHYRKARKDLKTYEMKGHGTKINGTYYLQVSKSERQKVHDMIVEQLS